jgi:hypothetical protein
LAPTNHHERDRTKNEEANVCAILGRACVIFS